MPTISAMGPSGLFHWVSPPRLSPSTTPPKPSVEKTIDQASTRGRDTSRTSFNHTAETTSETSMTGTMSQKIHRQLVCSRMTPAITGETAGANMTTIPMAPIAVPMRAGG